MAFKCYGSQYEKKKISFVEIFSSGAVSSYLGQKLVSIAGSVKMLGFSILHLLLNQFQMSYNSPVLDYCKCQVLNKT